MEDDGRMMKMGKSCKDVRLFEEKRKISKHKKGNMIYTIYKGNYERKSNSNLDINLIFYVNHRLVDATLMTILILFLILPPQQTWTPKRKSLGLSLSFSSSSMMLRESQKTTKKKEEDSFKS